MMEPLSITKGLKQYLTTNTGEEYLDCLSDFAIVGHNHPQVTIARQNQTSKLATAHGFHNEVLVEVSKLILKTLPENFSVCYLVNSPSEANDLALKLARNYTNRNNFLAFDGCTHGSVGILKHLDPKCIFTKRGNIVKIPVPNLYNGFYREDDPNAVSKYLYAAEKMIHKCAERNESIAALICEPVLTDAGVIRFPENYFNELYRKLENYGCLWIADERKTGLGRAGEHFWAFQELNIVPDILTVGRQIGNGHPISAVITTKEIAESIGEYASTFGGNPVSCIIAMTVLEIIKNELLIEASKAVGKTLKEEFHTRLERKFGCIGQIRGKGLCIGIEIVIDQESNKPNPKFAMILVQHLRTDHQILIDLIGPHMNVLYISPPLCFTQQNARNLVYALESTLMNLTTDYGDCDVSVSSGSSTTDDTDSPCVKKPRMFYEDVD